MTAAIFAALGDETRLELVKRLTTEGPQTTLTLLRDLPMSRQAASRHLQLLEDAGLVISERQGREVVRRANTVCLDEAASWLARRAMEWDMALDRLRSAVESQDSG